MVLQEGQRAPHFTLPAVGDDDTTLIEQVRLADQIGQPMLLLFSSKRERRGKLVELAEFRDVHLALSEHGVVVFAISTETLSALKQDAVRYHLPFLLLSDSDAAIARSYGAWTEKRLFGKPYHGIERTTVLINREGSVQKIWRRVKPEGHAQEVLAAVEALVGPPQVMREPPEEEC